jgi:predicted MFS family arabinose efflux permease
MIKRKKAKKMHRNRKRHKNSQPYIDRKTHEKRKRHKNSQPYIDRKTHEKRKKHKNSQPYIDRKTHEKRKKHKNSQPYIDRKMHKNRKICINNKIQIGSEIIINSEIIIDREVHENRKICINRKTHKNSKGDSIRRENVILTEITLEEPEEVALTETSLAEKEEIASIQATLDEPIRSKINKSTGIDNRLIWIMAIACGITSANLYYMQPLLANMGHKFAVSINQIGFAATLGQLGFAAGLLLIVPLGDKYNQRILIISMLCLLAVALTTMALAWTIVQLSIASFAVGLTTIIPELIIPFAVSLVPSNERGRTAGFLLSGLLVGILLARTVSGFVGEYVSWQAMYWIAAVITILLAVLLHFLLPRDHTLKREMSYPQLLSSLWGLLRSEPVLQEINIFGLLAFASFNAFWVILSFFLDTPPYHYGSEVAGLFGLAGIASILMAPATGKFADRRDARLASGAALVAILLSFVLMWLTGQWLISLIFGVILLDVGVQVIQVSCQARLFSLNPAARNRFNTIYMFMFFLGGSLGTLLGTFGWSIAKWNGVCGIACFLLILAVGFYILNSKHIRQWKMMQ